MNIELDENGYTLDGKWKLVPVIVTADMAHKYIEVARIDIFNGTAYSAMINASPKPEIETPEYKRSSDITLDDELLPEFADMWCRSCGDKVPSHLRNCPTLMSKL